MTTGATETKRCVLPKRAYLSMVLTDLSRCGNKIKRKQRNTAPRVLRYLGLGAPWMITYFRRRNLGKKPVLYIANRQAGNDWGLDETYDRRYCLREVVPGALNFGNKLGNTTEEGTCIPQSKALRPIDFLPIVVSCSFRCKKCLVKK